MESDIKDIIARLDRQEILLNQAIVSVEKTRRYMLWALWASIAFFVLPLIGLVIAVPVFLSSYIGSIQGLGL
jgi:uncharacterized membrane protein